MAIIAYDVDPEIHQNAEMVRRRDAVQGIAPGRKVNFPMTPDAIARDWTLPHKDPNTATSTFLYDGALNFIGYKPDAWQTGAVLKRPANLENTIVTLGFKLCRHSHNPEAEFLFTLPGGLAINTNYGGYCGLEDGAPSSGINLNTPSKICKDTEWHEIVMAIQSGSIMVWEDDVLVATWTRNTSIGNALEIAFGVRAAAPGDHGTFALKDVSLIVGTTLVPKQKRDSGAITQIHATHDNYTRLVAKKTALDADINAATQALKDADIGPSALFWGFRPTAKMRQSAHALVRNPHLETYKQTAAQEFGGSSKKRQQTSTFSVSLGLTGSFLISGGYQIGLLIGADGVHAFLTLAVGAVTNVGFSATTELALYPLPIDKVLGFGAYVEIGAGEFFTGGFGLAGNIPLDFHNYTNCGPVLHFGMGFGGLPVDISGGISYTFDIAKLS